MIKIVGYGLCGPGEADKYLDLTLRNLEDLCDEVIILLNNVTDKERKLIETYGFKTVEDNREWGVNQWKIKEDFVTNHVAKLKPDMCVCVDMDEVFDKNLTRYGLYELYEKPFDAFAFHIIDLWDDGYLPELSFWNIRAFRWNGDTKFAQKNLHCGLAPEWTWAQHYFAPYLLKHYGLKEKAVRQQKAERYKKYDPTAKWLSLQQGYYQLLEKNPRATPFDEEAKHKEVVDFVINIKQKFVKNMKEEQEIVYIKLKGNGEIVPVPKNKLDDYTRQGHTYEYDHKELMEELDDIINEPVKTPTEISTEAYRCDKCDYSTDNKRKLHGHNMGKHKK
jgi:hypothetical protein